MARALARRSAKGAWRHPSGNVFGRGAIKSRCSPLQIEEMEPFDMKLPSLSGAVPLWIKIVAAAALFAIIFAGFKSCTATTNHKTDVIAKTGEEKGAATTAAAAATKGLENVEKGNAAAAAVGRDDGARRAGCLRHSRTPENC